MTTPRLYQSRPEIEIPDHLRQRVLLPDSVAAERGIADQSSVHGLHGKAGYQRDPHDEHAAQQDRELIRLGIMDEESFHRARHVKRQHHNPIRIVCTAGDKLFRLIYRDNLRTNAGTAWMGYGLNGSGAGTANGFGLHVSGTASASSATGFTSNLTPTANQWVGHIAIMGASYGYVTAHGTGASAVFTIDRWYDTTVTTGAALGTPPTAGTFVIVPGQGPAFWMGLSNDATAVNTTDTTLPSELTTNGMGRARSTISFTPPSGAGTTTNQGTYTMQVTFVDATAASSFQKTGILNAQNAGILVWDSLVTATTLQISDQAQLTWTVNF